MPSERKSHFVLSILLALFTIGRPSDGEPADFLKIENGNAITPGDYPYYVDAENCGGALIANDIVLTAGHCSIEVGKDLIIGAVQKGKTTDGAQKRKCAQWMVHPLYNSTDPARDGYDVGMCRLDEPVVVVVTDDSNNNNHPNTIVLELNENAGVPVEDHHTTTTMEVIGLGYTEYFGPSRPRFAQVATIPYVDRETCGAAFAFADPREAAGDSILCASAKTSGTCFGDSGGPLVIARTTTTPTTTTTTGTVRSDSNSNSNSNSNGKIVHVHVGLVSFGIQGTSCVQDDSPIGFARTSAVVDWIKTAACSSSSSSSSSGGGLNSGDDEFCGRTKPPTQSPTQHPTNVPTRPPTTAPNAAGEQSSMVPVSFKEDESIPYTAPTKRPARRRRKKHRRHKRSKKQQEQQQR